MSKTLLRFFLCLTMRFSKGAPLAVEEESSPLTNVTWVRYDCRTWHDTWVVFACMVLYSVPRGIFFRVLLKNQRFQIVIPSWMSREFLTP